MSLTETELIAKLRAQDPASFEEIVRQYSARLTSTAGRIFGNDRDSQDAVQDAFISAWQAIGTFKGESSLYTWLHRITVNVCLARMRSSQFRNEVSIADENHEVGIAYADLPAAWSEPSPDMENRLAMRQSIERALKGIPEEFRTVLILRDVEDFSSREVAEQLGLSDATVRQRLHRARAAMAEQLRPELCNAPPLTCGGQLDLLFDYIDNALAQEQQGPVGDHIRDCVTCSGLLHTYRATVGLPRAILDLTAASEPKEEWIRATVTRAGSVA